VVQKEIGNKQADPLAAATAAKSQIQAFASAQTEAWETYQELSWHWLDRVQAEASLASDLAAKLSAAWSVPDAIAAYQTWGSRRFEMMTEDTKHLWEDTQKFMQTGARLLQSQSTGPSA
jgi:hypothetical protein